MIKIIIYNILKSSKYFLYHLINKMNDEENSEIEELGENEEDNQKNQTFIYLNKYGSIYPDDKTFNHKSELGEKCIQYKPEKIIVWIGNKNGESVISGLEITYVNVIDGTKIEFNNMIGKYIKNKYIFNIKPTEYLIDFKIWLGDNIIYKIYFRTNKGIEFKAGESLGQCIGIGEFKNYNIITSFLGNYNNYLTAFSAILIDKVKYIKILFKGYYELKALLKKENKRKDIMKKLKEGKYKNDDVALIKTCLLSDNPFNGVIKYCIV